MELVDVVVLNRARTTFQRVSDAKFFNGWVKHITPDVIVAHTCTNAVLEPGDKFSFQVYGNKKDAFFHATLTAIHGAEQGPFYGSNATTVELGCNITTEMHFKEAQGQPRFCVDGMSADVVLDENSSTINAPVIDIGPGGFAAVTGRHFKKGDLVNVSLYANGQLVQCFAEVRNCIVNGLAPDYQRTGMQIKRMDRVDALRWKQLYLGILEGNKMQGATRTAEVGTVVKLKSKDAA